MAPPPIKCPHCEGGHKAVLRPETGEFVHNRSTVLTPTSKTFSTVVCVAQSGHAEFRAKASGFLKAKDAKRSRIRDIKAAAMARAAEDEKRKTK